MAANFDQSYEFVLKSEGGNSDDPHDHGGRTSRGITQRTYDAWCTLTGNPKGDVWYATDDNIKMVYWNQYWNPYCEDLADGIDYLFFDISVNAGRTQAVRQFQKALGIKVDGMIGQETRAALKNIPNPVTFIRQVSEVRRNFYRSLKQFPRYGRGWLSRVDFAENNAIMIASKHPNPVAYIPEIPPLPKADETQPATTKVSPEAAGTTAVATTGLASMIDQVKGVLYSHPEIKYVGYALLGISVVSIAYTLYALYIRNKVNKAL